MTVNVDDILKADRLHEQQKETRRSERTEAFKKLVQIKFGTQRGYKSRAAEALQCHIGNFCNMFKGGLTIPDRYFIKLKEMPNYELPELPAAMTDIMDEASEEMFKRITFEISWADFDTFISPLLRANGYNADDVEDMSALMLALFKKVREDYRNKNNLDAEDPLA